MKKYFFYTLSITLFAVIFISSCNQDSQTENDSNKKNTGKTIGSTSQSDTLKPPVIKPCTTPYMVKLSAPQIADASFFSVMQNYDTEKGLCLSLITCSFKDSKGNLWFGTISGGVSCFNGKNFINYTIENGLPSNDIRAITEDTSGNLWFGSYGYGVSRYNGKFFHNFTKENELSKDYITSALADSKGNIWFGTWGKGLVCYNGKSFINHDTLKGTLRFNINCMCFDKEKNIWIGTESAGVCKFDGETFTQYSKDPDGLIDNTIQSICMDDSGKIWIGSQGKGFSIYDGKKFGNMSWAAGSPNNDIRSLFTDAESNVWMGTANGGMWVYYKGDVNNSTNFAKSNGLTSMFMTTTLQDNEGNMWFGSNGGGVDCYNGKAFMNFSSLQGLPMDQVFTINENIDSNIWIGTHGGGLSIYNNKKFFNYTETEGLFANSIVTLFRDSKNTLWLGTNGWGLIVLSNDSLISISSLQGLVSNYVYSVAEDKNRDLWFGTSEGLSHFDGKKFTNYTKNQGLPNEAIRAMLFDKKGNLWMATVGAGLCFFNGKTFVNYTVKDGLPSNNLWSLYIDKNDNIWCGTNGKGVSCFNRKQFINYSTKHGLPNNTIKAMCCDNENNLWFGTNNGLAQLGAKEIEKASSQYQSELPLKIFNSSTGYLIKNLYVNALFCDSKGVIWAGTGDKLIRLDPAAINKSKKPLSVMVQSLKINQENISWYNLKTRSGKKITQEDSLAICNEEMITFGKPLSQEMRDQMLEEFKNIEFAEITKFTPLPTHLKLPHSCNDISFEYCALQPSKSYLVKYQYMLEGYDKTWSHITNKTNASFGNIPEGNYTFKVKAQSTSGVWSEPVSYHFKVFPPWHRTWWAYTLWILIFGTSVWLIIRWRTSALKHRQLVLEQTVTERTAEVVQQKEVIEEHQKEIIDSINYAKRIQYALLAHTQLLQDNLPEHFVLFQPKDIVSGDFYWATKKNNKFYLAVCDCTGHGVPGAFMSLLNISFLNEAINEINISQPHEVLNHVRKRLIESVSKDGGQDGMDAILICIDQTNNTITYTAANNAPLLIKNNEILSLDADKMPVGKGEKNDSFTLRTIQLEKGDSLYLYTDGYPDQFGGPKGKKFKYKPLNELFLQHKDKPLFEQKNILASTFENWKGGLEQVDDVCLIGIKL